MSASESIPLAVPTIAGNARSYLEACLETNFVSSVGPFVRRFEDEFASYVDARFAVACASGTAALHLAMRVLDLSPGDEVFLPTLTFIASANPVTYERATPVLVDAERLTYGLDPAIVTDELERRARAGIRQPAAIEVVHLLGHPADIEPLLLAADRFGVPLIEDAAEALGATYVEGPLAGRHVGTIGTVGCFSFNGNKIMTTGGGGMLVTDDEDLATRARHLSTQARLPGRSYQHDDVGYNYRLTNLAAALGVAQLEILPELLEARRRNAAVYQDSLSGLPQLEQARHAPWAAPTFWLYTPALTPSAGMERDALLDALGRLGIEARPIWTPLHRTDVYRSAPRLGGETADDIAGRAFSLPSSSNLTDDDLRRVVQALESVLRGEEGRLSQVAPS